MSTNLRNNISASNGQNKLRPQDRAVHDWYRFVLSFPPHLVQTYLNRFSVSECDTVLDPFCGAGTTLVECKKRGIASVGIEQNPMAHFASSVKVDWSIENSALLDYADQIAVAARKALDDSGIGDWNGLTLFGQNLAAQTPFRGLSPEQSKLLLRGSISPAPLHRTLVLLEAIDSHGAPPLRQYGRLALADALVKRIGNLKFGPEVGVGKIKDDAPVLDAWLERIRAIARDIASVGDRAHIPAQALKADSRQADRVVKPRSVDAVITSPPYPNEKDYTRTTRLDLFPTRPSTVTGEQLREEVVLLEWPGD